MGRRFGRATRRNGFDHFHLDGFRTVALTASGGRQHAQKNEK